MNPNEINRLRVLAGLPTQLFESAELCQPANPNYRGPGGYDTNGERKAGPRDALNQSGLEFIKSEGDYNRRFGAAVSEAEAPNNDDLKREKLANMILRAYGKFHNAGQDALNFLYNQPKADEQYFSLMNKYDGDDGPPFCGLLCQVCSQAPVA